jgi:hypothetical protein
MTAKIETTFWTDFLHKFSSITTAVRTLAYIRRFIDNSRDPAAKNKSFLNTNELQKAKTLIVRQVQAHGFHEEIKAIKQQRPIKS